jgi:hypothetical protein
MVSETLLGSVFKILAEKRSLFFASPALRACVKAAFLVAYLSWLRGGDVEKKVTD